MRLLVPTLNNRQSLRKNDDLPGVGQIQPFIVNGGWAFYYKIQKNKLKGEKNENELYINSGIDYYH